MPNMKLLQHEGDNIEIRLGEILTLNTRAQSAGVGQAGSKVEIFMWHYDYAHLVGLRAYEPEYMPGWNDLEGEVGDEQGWWMEMPDLMRYTNIVRPRQMVVSKNHMFKGKELKDMPCKFLAYIQKTKLSFVEFEEDIGGCSADGLGRRGHCIAVPTNILKTEPAKKLKAKSKEK